MDVEQPRRGGVGVDEHEAAPGVDGDRDERESSRSKSISRDMRGAFWSLPSSVYVQPW